MKSIPADELEALRLCHVHHGRNAKSLIRRAWFSGNYSWAHSSIDTSALQRFRNSEHGGNKGLQRVTISRLPEPPAHEP